MYSDRKKILAKLESEFDATALLYVTGDRTGLETQIAPDQLPHFVEHLDVMGLPKKIALIIYSRGGSTLAAWSLVNLLRQFTDHLTVIVPLHAHSAATLVSLGANEIVMTKQATLGPIDPSVNGPLNPTIPGKPPNVRAPVSVEAVAGYFDLAKDIAGLAAHPKCMSQVMEKLTENVHPLALGEVYRARTQIQQLARKLLSKHYQGAQDDTDKIISTLCGDVGSHDYAIYRREAKGELKLPVEKATAKQYPVIKSLYDDFASELKLREPLDISEQPVECKRLLIESIAGGSTSFSTKLSLTKTPQGVQPKAVDGWNHEAA